MKNRLVCLPVYTGYAHPGGWVSELMVDHYARLSSSGVGMVVVANAAVSERGVVSVFNVRVDKDDYIEGLSRLARTIQKNGAIACLQLNHAGRFARTPNPLLPSALDSSNVSFNIASLKSFMDAFSIENRFSLTQRLFKYGKGWNKAMTTAEMEETIAAFGSAAARACEAGFDMIEIHGAGGYLLSQFLSSFAHKNRFGDALSLNERSAFPLAVVREVKQRVPDNFPVGFRLIMREWVPEGIEPSEAISFARMLEKEGLDYVSASAATYLSMFLPDVKKQMDIPGYLTEDVACLTARTGMRTIVSGRIRDPEMADQVIARKTAHLVGIGRALRADPDWVTKAITEKGKIRKCMNCNWCIKRVVLDRGFNCRRWSGFIQEKTELEFRLTRRGDRGLFVVASASDVGLIRNAISKFYGGDGEFETVVRPTLLILKSDQADHDFDDRVAELSVYTQGIANRLASPNIISREVPRPVELSYNREIRSQLEKNDYSIVFIPRDPSEGWRTKIAFRQRGNILVFIGTTPSWSNMMVPVDMSISTLLTLTFLKDHFLGKAGISIQFIHVRSGPQRAIDQRWLKIKRLVGLDKRFPLRTIDPDGDIADELMQLVQTENFDAIVIGRRGLSRIKRWLLGSVSAKLLRRIDKESLIIID